MGYDSLYMKLRDREKAIEQLKKQDIIFLIILTVGIPAALFGLYFLLLRRLNVNVLLPAVASAAAVGMLIFDFVKKRKNNYRYVHCTHDTRGIIKRFEAKNGKGVSFDNSYGGSFNEGKVFKYTLFNETRVNCDVDFGVYTFTVFNDEWDEVRKYTAESEEDFKRTFKQALKFAASLEKKPDGEYDETLPVNEPEEDGYDEEDEEDEEKED